MNDLGHGLSALVVDDEAVILLLFEELLPDLGFSLQTCADVTSARAYLAEHTPDVVILDKNLPDGSGLDIAQELADADCAVVMISGFANVSSAVAAIQLGVADYIVKPFDISDVEARLHRVVDALALRRKNRALLADLSAQNALLERLVATDHVTGVSNFAFFRQRLTDEVYRSRDEGAVFSLILFDLDGFADLNQRAGYARADALLAHVADALKGLVDGFPTRASDDVVARIGADEFALLLPDTGRDGAVSMATEIQRAFYEHLDVPGRGPLTASIGTATFPEDGADGAALFAALECAALAAKRAHERRTALVAYSDDIATAGRERREAADKLSRQLRALDDAIRLGDFTLLYQPIVAIDGSAIFAYEALARTHNDAFAHAGELFDVAARAGRGPDLSRVLREMTIEAMSGLKGDRRMFINLHPFDLEDAELLGGAERSLFQWAPRIVLEITEVDEIRNLERARTKVDILRRHGFQIAVDDLGSGYSGLNHLAMLSPDFVKLDMALIRGIDRNPRKRRLISHLVDFAEGEGMRVIAEGVETAGEYETVNEIGVHMVQGYYIAYPSPPFWELGGD